MKAILVIDMPRDCGDCPCIHDEMWTCQADKEYREGEYSGRPAWCPLKPLPPYRYTVEDTGLGPTDQILVQSGWNDCLDEITGETDESHTCD